MSIYFTFCGFIYVCVVSLVFPFMILYIIVFPILSFCLFVAMTHIEICFIKMEKKHCSFWKSELAYSSHLRCSLGHLYASPHPHPFFFFSFFCFCLKLISAPSQIVYICPLPSTSLWANFKIFIPTFPFLVSSSLNLLKIVSVDSIVCIMIMCWCVCVCVCVSVCVCVRMHSQERELVKMPRFCCGVCCHCCLMFSRMKNTVCCVFLCTEWKMQSCLVILGTFTLITYETLSICARHFFFPSQLSTSDYIYISMTAVCSL